MVKEGGMDAAVGSARRVGIWKQAVACILLTAAGGASAATPFNQTNYVDLVIDAVTFGLPASYPLSFVKRNGSRLFIDGQPFYFSGLNMPWLTTVELLPDGAFPELMQMQADQGAQVLRVFAFSNGVDVKRGTGYPMQRSVGDFYDRAFRRMDRMLLEGGKRGLRFVLTLGNGYDYQGGPQWWVDGVLGGGDFMQFYTNQEVRSAYKAWMARLVGRVNHYTGLAYRDDPAILCWELLNEAHTPNEWDATAGVKAGSTTLDWFADMSAYLRQLDPNHLIATGEEGYRAGGGQDKGFHWWWMDSGMKGMDMERILSLPDIDIATLHIIPQVINVWAEVLDTFLDWFLRDRVQVALDAGKAIYLGEFGLVAGFGMSDRNFVSTFADRIPKFEMAGALLWPRLSIGSVETLQAVWELYESEIGVATKDLIYGMMHAKASPLLTQGLGAGQDKPDACVCSDVPPADTTGSCYEQIQGWNGATDLGCTSPTSYLAGYCMLSCERCQCTPWSTATPENSNAVSEAGPEANEKEEEGDGSEEVGEADAFVFTEPCHLYKSRVRFKKCKAAQGAAGEEQVQAAIPANAAELPQGTFINFVAVAGEEGGDTAG